jgi:hypothetical protein
MPDEDIRLALRTADQARTDFAIIEDELEAIYACVARLPSRVELWRVCLIGMLGGSVLTTVLGLAFAAVHWHMLPGPARTSVEHDGVAPSELKVALL